MGFVARALIPVLAGIAILLGSPSVAGAAGPPQLGGAATFERCTDLSRCPETSPSGSAGVDSGENAREATVIAYLLAGAATIWGIATVVRRRWAARSTASGGQAASDEAPADIRWIRGGVDRRQ